jgi:hypothetical protein
LCLGDFAVFGKAWRKAALSRNAGQIGLGFGLIGEVDHGQ